MTRRFSVQVIALNGQAYNETLPLSSLTFNVLKNRKNGQGNLKLVLVQDRYGSEITWKVYGPNNTIVAFGGPYDDLKSNTTLTLNENIPIQETGCYYFEIKDKAGDGINNGRGVGSYDITDETGAVLASSNGKYKNGEVRYFSMSKGSSVEEIQNTANQVSVYPIPAKQILTFSSASTMQEISIYNTTGQLLKSISTHGNHAEIRIDDLKNGLYIAKIITDELEKMNKSEK
ncbi:MAG: T9SS type A sorting domain-containing protein, partial [Bacteroidales bacterium]